MRALRTMLCLMISIIELMSKNCAHVPKEDSVSTLVRITVLAIPNTNVLALMRALYNPALSVELAVCVLLAMNYCVTNVGAGFFSKDH